MVRLWLALLPELRRFPVIERAPALQLARATGLDIVELLGMALGVMLVTASTRYVLGELSLAARLEAMAANFVVALPLLAIALGPFHVRRLRRGLRAQLHRRTAS